MTTETIHLLRKYGPVALAAKLALVGALALAGPAQAAPHAGLFAAVLASPVAEPRQAIVDGVLWKCAGEQCSAPAQGSRAAITCARVARKLGPVVRFSSPQGDLSADEITRCNATK